MQKEPILLSQIPCSIPRVEERLNKYPALAIPNFRIILKKLETDDIYFWDEANTDLETWAKDKKAGYEGICRYLRQYKVEEILPYFNEVDLAAMLYSHVYSVASETERVLESMPVPLITRKLALSSHHCGGNLTWNQIAEAYENLRTFTLNHPDFTYYFDTSAGFQRKGWSRYSKTFLDGELAILIYYKGKHAITTSFSVYQPNDSSRPQLLLQQIQLKSKKGNRFLYHLKPNYVEAITAAFITAFSGFDILLIHGDYAADIITKGLQGEIDQITRLYSPSETSLKAKADLEAKLKFITSEIKPRLERIYNIPFQSLCKRICSIPYWDHGFSLIQLA